MNWFCVYITLAIMFLFIGGCTNPSTPAGNEGYVKENPRIWGKGDFKGVLLGIKGYDSI